MTEVTSCSSSSKGTWYSTGKKTGDGLRGGEERESVDVGFAADGHRNAEALAERAELGLREPRACAVLTAGVLAVFEDDRLVHLQETYEAVVLHVCDYCFFSPRRN